MGYTYFELYSTRIGNTHSRQYISILDIFICKGKTKLCELLASSSNVSCVIVITNAKYKYRKFSIYFIFQFLYVASCLLIVLFFLIMLIKKINGQRIFMFMSTFLALIVPRITQENCAFLPTHDNMYECNTCPIFLCQVQEAYCERYHERVVALLDSFGEATKKFHTAVSHSRASMLCESPVSRCRIHEFAAPILNHSTPRALWGVDRTERQREESEGSERQKGLPIKQCSHICQPLLLPLPW